MKKLIWLFFLAASSLAAQGIIVAPKTVLGTLNGQTRPISNATITVCAAGASGIPCAPALANTVFVDAALTVSKSNPFTTDSNGNYQFAIAPGVYTVTETGSGFVGYSYQLSVSCVAGQTCLAPLGGNLAFTGNNTHSGTEAFNGGLTSTSGSFSGNLSATAGANTLNAYSFNNVVYVDGVQYPFTNAGVAAALTAACNGSVQGKVVLPPNQTITATPAVPNNCTLEGAGAGTIIQSAANSTIVSAASGSPAKITLRNFRIDGSNATGSSNTGLVINGTTTGPTDIVLENLTITNNGGYGWQVTGTSSTVGDRLTVRNVKALGGGLAGIAGLYCGLFSHVSDVEITDSECSGAGFVFGFVSFNGIVTSSASAVHNITIKGAQIHDIGQTVGTGGTGIDLGRVRNVSVTGSNFRNIGTGQCITFESPWAASMAGNTCDGTVTPATQSSILLKQPDTTITGDVGSSAVSITGNTIYQPSGGASVITANGSMEGVSIVGNTVLMNTTAGVNAILLQPGSVDANIVASGWGQGDNITVSGNALSNIASLGGNTSIGIDLIQPSTQVVDQVIISNNTARGFNDGVAWSSNIASNGITHAYVHDNAVEGNTTGILNGDSKTYSSLFYWNNNPPSGTGQQTNYVPQIPLQPVTFATLGTPSNGLILYCSDCTIANPCAGSGTGAIAKRLNGIWVCN